MPYARVFSAPGKKVSGGSRRRRGKRRRCSRRMRGRGKFNLFGKLMGNFVKSPFKKISPHVVKKAAKKVAKKAAMGAVSGATEWGTKKIVDKVN